MFERNAILRPLLFCFGVLFFFSCSDNDDGDVLSGKYARGYLIVNEGVFQQKNSSISHIDRNGEVTQDIFRIETGDSLGDNLQSITVDGKDAYLMVSASDKIEVVDRTDFSRQTTITGNFANPRYMALTQNNEAYISSWGNFDNIPPQILIIDTQTGQIKTTLPAGSGAEDLIYDDNTKQVAVSSRFGTEILIYDAELNTLADTIDVSPNQPGEMVFDKDGNLWVIAIQTDFSDFSTSKGAIYQIDLQTNEIIKSISLDADSENVNSELSVSPDGHLLYYSFSSQIFNLPISASSQSPRQLIAISAYGIEVDERGNIWASIADFQSLEGNSIIKYNSDGDRLATYATGFAANGIVDLP